MLVEPAGSVPDCRDDSGSLPRFSLTLFDSVLRGTATGLTSRHSPNDTVLLLTASSDLLYFSVYITSSCVFSVFNFPFQMIIASFLSAAYFSAHVHLLQMAIIPLCPHITPMTLCWHLGLSMVFSKPISSQHSLLNSILQADSTEQLFPLISELLFSTLKRQVGCFPLIFHQNYFSLPSFTETS